VERFLLIGNERRLLHYLAPLKLRPYGAIQMCILLLLLLHKKGLKSDTANYRPDSLTSVCCKLLGSLKNYHIINYLLENDPLSNRQYRFAKGRSTMLQLLHWLEKWTEYLEKGKQIDTIYSDFEKAFDKVPHKKLISKLHSYGLHGSIINWI